MRKNRRLEIIEVNRNENYCYVALYSENMKHCTNTSFPLDVIEKLFGITFDEQHYDFLTFMISKEDLKYIRWGYEKEIVK